jgi:hypothetical protein
MEEYELFDRNVRGPEESSLLSKLSQDGSLFGGTGLN